MHVGKPLMPEKPNVLLALDWSWIEQVMINFSIWSKVKQFVLNGVHAVRDRVIHCWTDRPYIRIVPGDSNDYSEAIGVGKSARAMLDLLTGLVKSSNEVERQWFPESICKYCTYAFKYSKVESCVFLADGPRHVNREAHYE